MFLFRNTNLHRKKNWECALHVHERNVLHCETESNSLHVMDRYVFRIWRLISNWSAVYLEPVDKWIRSGKVSIDVPTLRPISFFVLGKPLCTEEITIFVDEILSTCFSQFMIIPSLFKYSLTYIYILLILIVCLSPSDTPTNPSCLDIW